MDHTNNRRNIGVLARFCDSSWSAIAASSLAEGTGDPRVILLGDADSGETSAAAVRRCWNYASNDLTGLQTAIAEEHIGVIHVSDPWLLTEWAISVSFLESFRKEGGITTVSLPQPQRRFHHPELIERCFDQILVSSEQDRIWLAASGISLDRIELIPAAGPRIVAGPKTAAARNVVIVCATQIEAQINDLLQNLHEIECGIRSLRLTVLASALEAERNSNQFQRIRAAIERSGSGAVSLQIAASNSVLLETLAAADIVIVPDAGGSSEQMAAVNCALGAPAIIVTTGLRTVVEAGAAFQVTTDDRLWQAIRLLFDRSDIQEFIDDRAQRWRSLLGPDAGRKGARRLLSGLTGMVKVKEVEPAAKPEVRPAVRPEAKPAVQPAAKPAEQPAAQSAVQIAAPASTGPAKSRIEAALENLKRAMPNEPAVTAAPADIRPAAETRGGPGGALRILMQNRPNMFTQRGGDTVVVENLVEQLRKRGASVDIDLEGRANPADYDVVHLHNFAIREVTENFARRAVAAGVPYVVTTLYEDWPKFFNQMMATFQALDLYVKHSQPRDRWDDLMRAIENVPASACWDNTYAATNAASLFVSGANEAAALRRDYQAIKRIDLHNFGCKVAEAGDGGEMFVRETGLKDFVLCVGRLETRKNQLMLLRALEDSDLTVVFAAGGFTYQPEYAEACRNFRRRGKTFFLDRLDAKLLASAYGACRVHALPSWYELPGLVSIEAALYGAAVVATEYGTSRDYLGDFARYCLPGNPDSIRRAVEESYQTPVNPAFREHVKKFTWENTADQVLDVYRRIVAAKGKAVEPLFEEIAPIHTVVGLRNAQITTDEAQQSVTSLRKSMPADSATNRSEPLDPEVLSTDKLVRAGKRDEAAAIYQRLIKEGRSPAAASRGLAIIALLERRLADAEKYFQQALGFDPCDFRALAGLGTTLWDLGRREEGFNHIVRACEGSPDDQAIMLQLINPSYALDKLEDLQAALERFIRKHPDDLDMCYCLAGCYYRRKRTGQAEAMLHRILLISPTHPGGLELRAMMQRDKTAGANPPAPLSSSIVSERTTAGSLLPAGLPGKPPAASIDQLTFQAEQAKKAQDFDQAIAVAQSILERSDATENQHAFAVVIMGESLGCKGDLVRAAEELRKAESNLAYGFRALNGLGALAAANEKYDEAEKMFRRSLSVVRENDSALAGLGICAMKRNEAQTGWDYFKQALEINPENMRAICGLIQLATSLGKLSDLERALETYLEFRPVDLSVLYSYAGCLHMQGKNDLASEQLRKILVFDPEHKMANDLLRQISDKPVSAGRPFAGI